MSQEHTDARLDRIHGNLEWYDGDTEEKIVDLLVDLLHYVDVNHLTLTYLLIKAERAYQDDEE